jgi:outer membrane protein
MTVKPTSACGLIFASLLTFIFATTPIAWAQATATPAAFDIPAQPLASALNAWAVQANLQVFFEQGPVAGLSAPAVAGTMLPTQALNRLLANTKLEYTQNTEAVFVIRARPVTVARTVAPGTPAQDSSASAVKAPVPLAPRSVRDSEGSWVTRLRASYLDPRQRSDALNVPTVPASFVPQDGTRTNGVWGAQVDLEYFFSSRWSSELAINSPQVHALTREDSSFSNSKLGDFRLMPDFLTLKYNFNPEGLFRPYAGVGVNITNLYHQDATTFALTKTTTGPAAQAGFDVQLSDHWLVNADVKWARVRPAIAFDGLPLGQMHIDPLLFGVGIGYRFGASPPPVAAAASAIAVPAVQVATPPPSPPVPDSRDKCPGTPPGLKVDSDGCPIEEFVLRGVNFKTNSAELTPESWPVLEAVAAGMAQRTSARAEIRGYTDARGAAQYNLQLSERRAAAVVSYLMAHGIPKDLLNSSGLGSANPVAPNNTAQGRAQNRRVTIQFSRLVPR